MATVSAGVVHDMPIDLGEALLASPASLKIWEETITPLARNEWICWVTSVKKQETRDEHVQRVIKELQEGKRRPCCWAGCLHRTDKKLRSASYGNA